MGGPVTLPRREWSRGVAVLTLTVLVALGASPVAFVHSAGAQSPIRTAASPATLRAGSVSPAASTLTATAATSTRTVVQASQANFTGSSTGGVGAVAWAWNFGGPWPYRNSPDTTTTGSTSVNYTYDQPGTYLALFVARDSTGATASATARVNVTQGYGGPSITGTANIQEGAAPLTVQFASNATAFLAAPTYAWSFGDGASAGTQYATHTYTTPGDYAAVVNGGDIFGDHANFYFTVVVGPPLLTDSASASTALGAAPLKVTLNATPAAGWLPKFNTTWTFGDGSSPGYGTQFNHTYTASGTFHPAVTVRDIEGNTWNDSFTVKVTPSLTPLLAGIAANVTSGPVPLTVHFIGNATGGTPTYTYAWAFGDGASSSNAGPTHEFNASGSYLVILTVTDAIGHTNTSTVVIQAGSGSSSSAAASPLSNPLVLGGIAAAVVAVAAVALLLRRRPPSGGPGGTVEEVPAPAPVSAADEHMYGDAPTEPSPKLP